MHIKEGKSERHTLSITVDNEAGILARIAGLFSARGYNIESLTVAEVSDDEIVSRITIVTSGAPATIEQIIAQLDRMVPVHKVTDLTALGPHVERELALLKVAGTGDHRIEALRLADVYRARVVDATTSSFVFEVTGSSEKVDTFIGLMREVGLIEVARTGVVAIARGREAV
jgi:acetolactate synthase-1/3 small subunit